MPRRLPNQLEIDRFDLGYLLPDSRFDHLKQIAAQRASRGGHSQLNLVAPDLKAVELVPNPQYSDPIPGQSPGVALAAPVLAKSFLPHSNSLLSLELMWLLSLSLLLSSNPTLSMADAPAGKYQVRFES